MAISNAEVPKSTVYESYEAGDDTDNGFASTSAWLAQTFTVGNTGTDEDFWAHSISLYLDGIGSAGEFNVSIQAVDGANKPDGTDLAFGTSAFDIATAPHWHRISFQKSAKLSSATQYALVVRRLSGGIHLWRSDDSSPSYGGGSYASSADSGATWTLDATKDFLFKIFGNTIPTLTFFQRDLQNADAFTTQDTGGVAGPQAYTQQFTQDIAMVVGKSSNLQGPLIFNVPINVTTLGNNNAVDFYYDFVLAKNSGGTETSLGTSTSKPIHASATGTTNFLSRIDISTQAHFKENDELILRVTFFAKVNDIQSVGAEWKIEFKDIWMDIPFKTNI